MPGSHQGHDSVIQTTGRNSLDTNKRSLGEHSPLAISEEKQFTVITSFVFETVRKPKKQSENNLNLQQKRALIAEGG